MVRTKLCNSLPRNLWFVPVAHGCALNKFCLRIKSLFLIFQSLHKKPADIEALRQGLDPPERFEFDSQADRELHRLGVKTKHLVDDWMEHYRVALGMASPALKRMFDRPKVTGVFLFCSCVNNRVKQQPWITHPMSSTL